MKITTEEIKDPNSGLTFVLTTKTEGNKITQSIQPAFDLVKTDDGVVAIFPKPICLHKNRAYGDSDGKIALPRQEVEYCKDCGQIVGD